MPSLISREALGIEIPKEINLKEDSNFFYLFTNNDDDEQIISFSKKNFDPQRVKNFILDCEKYVI